MMRRYIVYILLAFLMPLAVAAQSMTDDQVMAFVAKEHAAGTSNAQIVTKLMQRGVDISQIHRVRTKYESQMNQGSMSSVGSKNGSDASRMRTNNGKTRNDYGKNADAEAAEYSSQRVKAQPDRSYPIPTTTTMRSMSTFRKRLLQWSVAIRTHWQRAKTVSSVATSSIASFFRLSPI